MIFVTLFSMRWFLCILIIAAGVIYTHTTKSNVSNSECHRSICYQSLRIFLLAASYIITHETRIAVSFIVTLFMRIVWISVVVSYVHAGTTKRPVFTTITWTLINVTVCNGTRYSSDTTLGSLVMFV